MIRNSDFGRRLLQNWYKISQVRMHVENTLFTTRVIAFSLCLMNDYFMLQGLCPKGNFALDTNKYSWQASDQPGLWYALAQTHYEIYQPNNVEFQVSCTAEGFIETTAGAPMEMEFSSYFRSIRNYSFGVHGHELRHNSISPGTWTRIHHRTGAKYNSKSH
jgi:hypothetical protein